MSYEIEALSAVEKKITVQVPGQEVDIAIETVIASKGETIEQEEILSLAAQQIFAVRVKEAQKLYGIVPLNRIQIQAETLLGKGRDFCFSFVAEIIPDLEIPDYQGFEVEVKEAVVTEADIDRIIASLREQLSKLEEITEARQASAGDVVEIDFEALGPFKTMPGMSGTHHKLELGTGQTVKDFEDIIKSLKPGESKTRPVTYPADFPNPSLAGQAIETKITLRALNRKILPDIDEKLAQAVARVDSISALRDVLRHKHHQRLTQHYEKEARIRLLQDLTHKTEVPLAPTCVAGNLEDMISHYTMAMQQRGMTLTEISELTEEKRKQFLPDAELAAKRQLFLLAIAKKEQLKLETREVEQEIARQAQAAETDVNQFRLDAQQSGLLRNLKDDLMMRKVMNMLYDAAHKKIIS